MALMLLKSENIAFIWGPEHPGKRLQYHHWPLRQRSCYTLTNASSQVVGRVRDQTSTLATLLGKISESEFNIL